MNMRRPHGHLMPIHLSRLRLKTVSPWLSRHRSCGGQQLPSPSPLFVSISYSITERNSAIIQHYVFYRHKHQISGDGNDIKHADVAAAFSREGELWGKKRRKHPITITVGNTGGSQPCTLSWASFLTTQQPPLAQNCGSLKPLSLSCQIFWETGSYSEALTQ